MPVEPITKSDFCTLGKKCQGSDSIDLDLFALALKTNIKNRLDGQPIGNNDQSMQALADMLNEYRDDYVDWIEKCLRKLELDLLAAETKKPKNFRSQIRGQNREQDINTPNSVVKNNKEISIEEARLFAKPGFPIPDRLHLFNELYIKSRIHKENTGEEIEIYNPGMEMPSEKPGAQMAGIPIEWKYTVADFDQYIKLKPRVPA